MLYAKQAWSRAQGRCQVAGCISRYRLEIDQITPHSLGGANALANLRLACWHHNRQQARLKLCEKSRNRDFIQHDAIGCILSDDPYAGTRQT